MPGATTKVVDGPTQLVRDRAAAWLAGHGFAGAELRLDVYRKVPGNSIRVRVVHPRFAGKLIEDRDRMTDGLLADLPPDVDQDVTLVLLLSPDELEGDFMNAEFDSPAPVYL